MTIRTFGFCLALGVAFSKMAMADKYVMPIPVAPPIMTVAHAPSGGGVIASDSATQQEMARHLANIDRNLAAMAARSASSRQRTRVYRERGRVHLSAGSAYHYSQPRIAGLTKAQVIRLIQAHDVNIMTKVDRVYATKSDVADAANYTYDRVAGDIPNANTGVGKSVAGVASGVYNSVVSGIGNDKTPVGSAVTARIKGNNTALLSGIADQIRLGKGPIGNALSGMVGATIDKRQAPIWTTITVTVVIVCVLFILTVGQNLLNAFRRRRQPAAQP